MGAALSSISSSPVDRADTPDVTAHCEPLTRDVCDALQPEWLDLAESSAEKNIFQFPSFISNSLPLLARHNPQLLSIRNSGLLIGIVILRRDNGYAKLPIPFWRSALHHEQYLGTPLVRAGSEDAFAAGLCQWLDSAPRDCFFVKLSSISGDGALAEAIAAYCEQDGRPTLSANSFERAAIAPSRQKGLVADDLLTSSRRKSIRRATKRLQKEGEVSVERLSEAEQLDDWITDFLAMEDTGWKHEEGSSILSNTHETALYRAMIGEAFSSGNLHFARLCVGGKAIAYTLDIAAAPFGFCLKSAIDQNYRKFSPGVLMEHETLQYYLSADEFALLDSCSSPDNTMLNEMWPDRIAITDLAIARNGAAYSAIFKTMRMIKSLLTPKRESS